MLTVRQTVAAMPRMLGNPLRCGAQAASCSCSSYSSVSGSNHIAQLWPAASIAGLPAWGKAIGSTCRGVQSASRPQHTAFLSTAALAAITGGNLHNSTTRQHQIREGNLNRQMAAAFSTRSDYGSGGARKHCHSSEISRRGSRNISHIRSSSTGGSQRAGGEDSSQASPDLPRTTAAHKSNEPRDAAATRAKARRIAPFVGVAAGVFGSLVGVGGGVLIVPAMVGVCPGISQR